MVTKYREEYDRLSKLVEQNQFLDFRYGFYTTFTLYTLGLGLHLFLL